MSPEPITISVDRTGRITLSPAIVEQMTNGGEVDFRVIPDNGNVVYLIRQTGARDPVAGADTITLSGSLSKFGIADIFGLINMSQKTGVLTIMENDIHKAIYFRSGEIVFASSNQPEDRIGEVLYRTGKISRENLNEAEKAITPGTRFGTLLIKKQLVNPKDLWWGVKYQIEEIIYNSFHLVEGAFYFIEGDYAEEDLVRFSINTQHLLMEGFRRMDEWELIRDILPSVRTKIKLAASPPRIKLNDTMSNILALIDAEKTVGEVIRGAGIGAFNTCKALYQLGKSGILEIGETPEEDIKTVTDKPTAKKPTPTMDGDVQLRGTIEKYNNLFRHIYSQLSGMQVNFNPKETFDSFFSEVSDKHKQLFNEVHIDAAGALNPDQLLTNLDSINMLQSGAFTKIAGLGDLFSAQLLLEGLNEFLNFEIFAIKNSLDTDQADTIIKQIREMQQKLK